MLCIRDGASLTEATADFRRLFGTTSEPPYARVVALFDGAQPFGHVIRESELLQLPKRRLVQMTTALLRDGVLTSLHKYVHVVGEPPSPPADAPDVDHWRWRLYKRLRPMLYGEHHFDEIMWQERLGREALHELLAAYEQYLVLVVCPDEVVDS